MTSSASNYSAGYRPLQSQTGFVSPVPPPASLEEYLRSNPAPVDTPPFGAAPRTIVNLQLAKRAIRIPEVWELLKLPGYPAISCRSPFRQDKRPSFSIYDEGRRWKDHSTGDGGDVVDFIAVACNFDLSKASRALLWLLDWKLERGLDLAAHRSEATEVQLRTAKPVPPELRIGTPEELAQLADQRGLSVAGLRLASDAGILRFGRHLGYACWFVRDESGMCIEARRIDGHRFPHDRKALAIKDSKKNWPVGIKTAAGTGDGMILVTEGGPDLLAAFDLCARSGRTDCQPVAFLGRTTGGKIHPDALLAFSGKRVRIFPHADTDGGGNEAARLWGRQMLAVGADVDLADLSAIRGRGGHAIKDLNDLLRMSATSRLNLDALLPKPKATHE